MPEDVSQNSPLLQSCPDCAALLDISKEEPFASVICPMCGTSMRTRTEFNNFTLQKQIGVGGMGVVYKALDVHLNRLVALKVVLKEYSSDPSYHAKFEYEAQMAALVNHPHVVKVFSFGSAHGLFYIAMELVDRGSMEEKMTREGRLKESLVLDIGIQIAQGLQAAFQKGLIHRDVKPGNILFADEHTAKIVDFGLAVPMAHTAGGAKKGGEVWGTPYYIAPEKLSYEPEDFRSDIYSLGASLFHAIAGRPSFEGETTSFTLLRQLKSKPVSLQEVAPHVSSATAYVINRTLNVDPGGRFQSYDELIEHLNYARTKLLAGPSAPADAAKSAPEDASQPKFMSLTMQLAAVGILIVAALAFAFRDRIFPGASTAAAVPAGTAKPAIVTVDEKYQDARKHLIRGDYAGAQKAFHDLAQQNLPHPLDRWVLLHEGLSALLGGNLPESQAIFAHLQQSGVYSDAPEDRKLANFFVDVGSVMALAKPVPDSAVSQYDADNCEALGLFVFAVNNWEMSQFDDAGKLLQAFLGATPKQPYEWIADYKPVAQKLGTELESYRQITGEIKTADTLEKETKALEDLRAFKHDGQLSGKMSEVIAPVEDGLQSKVIADQKIRQAEDQRRAAELAALREKETKALDAAEAAFAKSVAGFQFDEGLDAIGKTQITDAALSTEKEGLLKKAQWLVQFKQTLVNDINTLGYPLPVSRLRTGAPMEGGVRRATPAQIEIQTQYGSLSVLWNELAPSQMLAISEYFTAKAATPAVAADRQWVSGVFAMETGMTKEGQALLQKAAQGRPEYAAFLPLFTGTASP